jgi:hypothetical protein
MNKNNSRRKKIDEQHENAKDILDMIRARQEQESKTASTQRLLS